MLGGDSGGVKVKINISNGLLATENTPVNLVEEKTFKQTHDILHYIDKDNPLGPIPENPGADSYYSFWEEPVQKWAAAQGIINEQPPTQLDPTINSATSTVN
jgi:hypothetical protein